MLTIPQQLPIKQLALYGSAALLVGFTGTLSILRELAPRGGQSGVSVVETINKRPATKATLASQQSKEESAASAAPLPAQPSPAGGGLPVQQSPRLTTVAPTYSPPTHSTAAPAAEVTAPGVVNGGGSQPSAPVTQPAPSTPAPQPVHMQPILTTVVSGVLGIGVQ